MNALYSQAKASEKRKGIDKYAETRYNATQQVPKGKAKRSSKYSLTNAKQCDTLRSMNGECAV